MAACEPSPRRGVRVADFVKVTGRYYANGVHGNDFEYHLRVSAIAMVAWHEARAVVSITGVDGTLIVVDEASVQRLKDLVAS